jgi:xanthine/CO dehydrogenase XdhC/CoxF family maturation factor
MQEHARMMAAWKAARGVCVLVTVVGTRGSSYRSPGARMLILPDGSRIGAVSGGCLEGELCRRAHWWTSASPTVLKTFDTSTQEDNEGFGLGCGGGIDLLLERLEPLPASERLEPLHVSERLEPLHVSERLEPLPASVQLAGADVACGTHPLLALERARESREAAALAVVLEATAASGLHLGERFAPANVDAYPEIGALLKRSIETGYSFAAEMREGVLAGCRVFCESLIPPVQLLVCGAGTDAQPVVAQAAALGWSVVVMDGRADFARESRFPDAESVIVAKDAETLDGLRPDRRTAAIVMSHSFAQDTFFLETLLGRPMGYVGVLGSRRRTLDLLARLGRDAMPPGLHAPAGLDIGAETPEQIALSILSEVQATFARRSGGALRDRDGSIHGREERGDDRGAIDERSRAPGNCGLL